MRTILKTLAGVMVLASCAVYVPAVTDPDPAPDTIPVPVTEVTIETAPPETLPDGSPVIVTAPPTTVEETTTTPPTTVPEVSTTVLNPTTTVSTTVPNLPAPGRPSVSGTVPGNQIEVPSGDNTGNFRVFCGYSHFNYDDSIVKPNQPGASHLHVYFGNQGSDANSTAASLLSSGESTCNGGILNRSSYWVPAVLDASGNPLVPTGNIIYYKSGYQGVDPGRGKEDIVLPNGLKMIAGSATATAPQQHVNWGCSTDPFGFPTNTTNQVIPFCPEGSTLHASIGFPQCWDGVNLDSPDHKSHMAYGTYGVGCPASHPVPLPEISYHIDWRIPAGGTTGWHLSSDMGQPGGLTFHADYIAAWDPVTSETWLTNCTRANADCDVSTIANGVDLAR